MPRITPISALLRLAAALSLAISASATQAQHTVVPKLDVDGRQGDVARFAKQRALEKFNAADTNSDGKLSREEVEKSFPYLAEKFDKHDKIMKPVSSHRIARLAALKASAISPS